MRVHGPLFAVLVGVIAAPTAADPTAARPATSLVRATAAWRWQVITAPRLPVQIGALAVSGLDVAAGRAAAPVVVLGEGAAPPRWPRALEGDLRAIPAPAREQRIAVAYGVTTFQLTASDQGLAMLELRLRYEDGVAVWLNHLEVARSALPRGGPMALAARPHGPEWETFQIPVGPGLLRLGENTLAIEVHPSGRRPAPTLSAELIGRRDREIVRGPVLAELGKASAQIAVETDPHTACVLTWGTGTTLDRRETSAPGRHHVFALRGLPARGQVRYRVHAGASTSAEHVFQVPPAAGDMLRIGVYGDVRGGHATHRKLVERMLAEPLDVIAVTGDMVLRGADAGDWQRFFAITAPLLGSVPYLPAVGNHDLGWGGADPARRARHVFTLPAGPPGRPPGTYWYSVELADVHLVFLDSNAYARVEQAAWLEADLAAARRRGVRAIIAITHDGPYSRGQHRGNDLARTRYVPILVRHRIDLLLAGHDHLYQRGAIGGLRYIVTGGGGAPLYAASCGARGKPRCAIADGMQALAREHHFLVLTLDRTTLEVCPRRIDGRLLEPCTRYPLRGG